MKKVLIPLIALLLLYGCNGENADQEGDVEAPDSPFIGGDDGIVAEFLSFGVYNEDTDTEEIFEEESFPIELLIENKGEEDLVPGDVRAELIGINLADFSGIPSAMLENTESIDGISEFNSVGEEETLDFTPGAEDAVYLKPIVGNSIDLSVFARIVYRYKTFASVPKVCFKEDPNDEGVCEIEEIKDVFSSSGPMQVQSAEQKRAGTGKIAVEFEIENARDGEVTIPGEPFDSRFDETGFSVSEPDLWECKSGGREGTARLNNDGKATIVCRLREAMEEDALFTKQLDLTLEYDYKILRHKQVRVRRQ